MQKDRNLEESTLEAIDWLMYRSYVFQRERSPDVHPTRWRALYLSQEAFEEQYQYEKQMNLAKTIMQKNQIVLTKLAKGEKK